MDDAPAGEFIPSLYKPPALLPVARHRDALLYTIETWPVTVIVGETGSGKTTQIPQFLDQAGWTKDGIVGVTQPRRVAATTVAARVAEEMRCSLGQDVGYSIRFEDATSEATRIKFLTDGMLLREALVDPLLQRYSVIMVDEAHERSLSSDILLGLLKKIRRRREDLRIVISSATLQAEDFLNFFAMEGNDVDKIGRIVSVEGRAFPVDVHYLAAPTEDYVHRAVETAFEIHTKEDQAGDILIFLTGREEIDTAVSLLSDHAASLHPRAQALQPLPLYAGLPTDQQMYVFEPAAENTRKCIVATNIAEASVTIDGVTHVIDCGFVKLRSYNPTTSIESLTAIPISKASATQRAGRAGRTKPGKCYRLYTEAAFASLRAATVPEIQRSNLAPLVLQLKALGIDNIVRFDFLTPPPAELLIRATELLYSLGALDAYAKLTRPLGVRMAEMALEPQIARCLLCSLDFGCLSQMLTIAAMVSIQEPFFVHDSGERKEAELAKRQFASKEGDHLTLLRLFTAFTTAAGPSDQRRGKWCRDRYLSLRALSRAVSVRNQLRRQLERFGMAAPPPPSAAAAEAAMDDAALQERIRRCIVGGFFAHAARMQGDGSFRSVDGGTVLHPHPNSVMFRGKADWVVFGEAVEMGKGKTKIYIKDVTRVEKAWLVEAAPEYYRVRQ